MHTCISCWMQIRRCVSQVFCWIAIFVSECIFILGDLLWGKVHIFLVFCFYNLFFVLSLNKFNGKLGQEMNGFFISFSAWVGLFWSEYLNGNYLLLNTPPKWTLIVYRLSLVTPKWMEKRFRCIQIDALR